MIRDRAGTTERGGRRGARRSLALLGVAALGLSGCTDWAGYDLDYFWEVVPALSTMRESLAYDPNDMPRHAPEGAIPVASPLGDTPPHFAQTALDSAAATLASPFAGGASPEALARGELLYANQCTVCHGPQGAGNGPVVGPGKFPFAPPINGAATIARSDGYIYGVIVAGRGLMPSYGERIGEQDRWAVVSYVRQLQGQSGATPAAASPVTAADTAAAGQL